MKYNHLKWLGAICWALTYIFFILIAVNEKYAMIPLIVCCYNISYELLYSIKADSKGQRLRNGIWFMLDIFIVYYHLNEGSHLIWFLSCFGVFLLIQFILTQHVNKSSVKGFAWFVTCLMAIILINQELPNSIFVNMALTNKLLGDLIYGVAHLYYGLPEKEQIDKSYYKWIQGAIVSSFFLNVFLLFF